jgi:hypothetical protein
MERVDDDDEITFTWDDVHILGKEWPFKSFHTFS